MSNLIENSYDVVMFLEVNNGNLNGDPDRNGAPRIDVQTGYGIATDVCIKRRIRDYLSDVHGDEKGYKLYISNESSLNEKDDAALEAVGVTDLKKKLKADEKEAMEDKILSYLTSTYADIRMFGAVLTSLTKGNIGCSRIRGPVQIDIAETIDPVFIQEMTISRCAISNSDEAKEKASTFGKKYVIPFGVYKVCIHVSGVQAKKTGMTKQDLEYMIDALRLFPEETRSAMRGSTESRDIFLFEHSSSLRNCTFGTILRAMDIEKKCALPVRYEDYEISVDEGKLPGTVKVTRL